MASNPAFNNPAFQDGGRVGLKPPAAPRVDAATTAGLEGAYAGPPAGAADTGRMTVEDTVYKTVGLFAIMLAFAALSWVITTPAGTAAPNPVTWIVGALGSLVLSLVVIFTSRKKVRPALIFAYAAFEGLFVGGISAFFEFIWPGIVFQATLATVAVVAVTLALFASGKIRASKKATKIFMVAALGYLLFSLVNIGLMVFNAPIAGGAFGVLSLPVAGIPLGVIIGILVVIMAAYALVLDFDSIQQGVRNGAPRQFAWMGAFGIMVTVVWLYVEILRILAILRGDS